MVDGTEAEFDAGSKAVLDAEFNAKERTPPLLERRALLIWQVQAQV